MSFAATTTLTPTNSSDANFRAWGSAFGTKFTSAGWVNTADTGQINWTTVTAAAGTNTAQGYEIWKFADALQGTVPVFFKIEYGSGSAINNPAIWVTVGSGSNGTGSLTGILSVRQQMTFTATATPITFYWSGDTNRFAVAANGASNTTSFFFAVERSVDNSGALTSEAVLLVWFSLGSWAQVAWNTTIGSPSLAEATLGCLGPSVTPFGTTGSQIAVYPIFHSKGVFYSPGLNGFAYFNALIASGSPITFTVYSGSHTYMPLGNTPAFTTSTFRASTAGGSLMMRYE
jgi:hypothetical protein